MTPLRSDAMSMLTVSMLPASLSEVRGAGWGAEKLAST